MVTKTAIMTLIKIDQDRLIVIIKCTGFAQIPVHFLQTHAVFMQIVSKHNYTGKECIYGKQCGNEQMF